MGRMVPVASSEGVTIHCPEEGKFSFFNSPFPAHYMSTGIDIYPRRRVGKVAPSPVEGRVVKIRRVKAPRGRGFRGAGFDFVILLKSRENPERVIKILHLIPAVRCGEAVEPGQGLGRLLRSGYFNFWTEPHIHLEVRSPLDPLRARGGFALRRLLEVDEADPVEELRGRVKESRREYSLIALGRRFRQGLPARVGGVTGLLDGGIPHYGFVGVHTREASPLGSAVELCGRPIGAVSSVLGDMCIADYTGLEVEVNGVAVGLSLYLYPREENELKIVPPRSGTLRLEEGVGVSLNIG